MIQPLPRPAPPPVHQSPLRFRGTPIRAIATDIDGTITDMARHLDWEAVTAFRAAEALGVPVLFATGNVIPVSKTFGHCIGTTGPHVCENGGTLYWESPSLNGGGPIVHRDTLFRRHEGDEVVKELVRRGHTPRYISSDPWRESEVALELKSVSEEIVTKTLLDMGKTNLYVVSTGFACHILDKGMNKFLGVKRALEWMNRHDPRFAPSHPHATPNAAPIGPEHVLAIGDSMNDLELIQGCGVGSVVANGAPDLQKVADIVAKSPHGAGVREILETVGLPKTAR